METLRCGEVGGGGGGGGGEGVGVKELKKWVDNNQK